MKRRKPKRPAPALLRRPDVTRMVWLHIDRLDRVDGRVWAVQWRTRLGPHYRVVHDVVVRSATGATMQFSDKVQPRAAVCFSPATVKVWRRGRVWRARITGARV